MAKKPTEAHIHIAKWFFLLLAVGAGALAWKIIAPFFIILVTAAIFAIILTPMDRWLIKKFKGRRRISAFVVMLGFIFAVLIPFSIVGGLIVEQAIDVGSMIIEAQDAHVFDINFTEIPYYENLPTIVQERVAEIDIEAIGLSISTTVGEYAASSVVEGARAVGQLFMHGFIFFLALFYFLVERNNIYQFMVELSPFQDKLDREILHRIVGTVRSVMLGALIIALIQGALAALGMAVAGVPGALLWGAVAVIAAQVPMIGVSLVMIPAVIYLALTGHTSSAVLLAIWSVTAVGLIDNVLTPRLLGGKTKMPEILILVFILGGLQAFGLIGFILGPTILAGIIVLVEIYRGGFLEGKAIKRI